MKKKLVVVFGIDGAGKTTLSKSVAERLRQQGVKAEYRYLRLTPRVTRVLMSLGRRILGRKKLAKQDYEAWTARKRQVMRRGILANIYAASLLTEHAVQVWWRLRGSQTVCIVDRYLIDTIITDLAVDLQWDPSEVDKRYRRWSKVLPKPSLLVYIDIDPEVAMKRKDDVSHVDYLRDRHRYYSSFAKEHATLVLDGTLTPEQVSGQLTAETLELTGGSL